MKPTRDGFGEGLIELGKNKKDVVVVSADLTESTRAGWFKKECPEKFFAVGVSEQDMMGAAAGFALSGKVAFACTFGVFASGRAWDQIRVSVCYMNLNVKIAGSHGGITVGEDGATHQALEEITLMRALPNMKIIVPCDALEAKRATIAAYSTPGPVYLRLGRNKLPVITSEDNPFEIGKADMLRQGNDLTIIACGSMVTRSLDAANLLSSKGIEARVINLHTPKPIDKKTIISAARETGALVTCEEHTIMGGMGSAVSEVLAQECPAPIEMVGINDRFGESGPSDELLKAFGLEPEDIVKAAQKVLKRK